MGPVIVEANLKQHRKSSGLRSAEYDRDDVFISQVHERFGVLRDLRCHTLVLAEHVPEAEGLD